MYSLSSTGLRFTKCFSDWDISMRYFRDQKYHVAHVASLDLRGIAFMVFRGSISFRSTPQVSAFCFAVRYLSHFGLNIPLLVAF